MAYPRTVPSGIALSGGVRSRSLARRITAAVTAAILATAAAGIPDARADGVADEAELHFQLGASAYQRSDFTGALEHFLLSNRLAPNRRVVYNIARSFEQLRQFADAHRYYIDALSGETDADIIKNIQAAIERVAPNVAVLDVTTTPPGAVIYIDRKDLGSRGRAPRPLAVPAGSYRVIAELEGYEPATSDPITVKTGGAQKIELSLKRIVGRVHVELEGGGTAIVRVDDERAAPACNAPCDLDLPPGTHQLHFERKGFQSVPRQVIVVAGKTAVVTAALRPETGSLVVDADEPGAQVTVDGRTMGFTPAVIPYVPVGKRKVKVTLRGYEPIERDIDIRPSEQAQLTQLELKPVREVTAVSRYAEQIDDAPSSVSIIDGRELRAFGYPTIAAALYGVRGVSLSTDRVYFSASVRGIGQPYDYGNRVLVLSDGQPLNDNLLNSSYIGSDGRADIHDIASIEVVRGPGSLLYGTGAFSGVINLITRPRDEPSHVHVSAGTYDDAVLRARGGFHLNLGQDKGVWASVSGAQSDGTQLNVVQEDPPLARTASGIDRFRSLGTAGRAWYGPLTAQWFYHKRYQSIPQGAYATLIDDLRSNFTDTRMMAEIRYEPRLSKTVELLLRAHGNRYIYDAYYQFEESANRERFAGSWVGGEARVVWSPVPNLRITAGGEGQLHREASLHGDELTPKLTLKRTYLNESKPYNVVGGYGLIEGSPAPWIRLSGGVRVEVYNKVPIVVPRAAVILKPVKGGTLKLMGGRAFRAASIYEQFYQDGGVSELPAVDPKRGIILKPERVYSGEVEYSQRFLEDWVALAAGHASYAEDIVGISPDTPGSEIIRYANEGAPVLVAGADVEVRREWRRGWMLGASYGYQHVQFIDEALSNPRLVNAPAHLASVRGVVPVVREIASIGLRVTLEAPRRIDDTTDDVTKTEVVADATISGEAKPFGLRYVVGVYNIADRRVEVPVAEGFRVRSLPQNGRSFMAELIGTYP